MTISAKLVVVGGEVKTAEIKLRLPATLGRARGCTIMLPHPLVSRQHCEIYEANGCLMVRDMGSLNGTFVNNQRIGEPAPLKAEELLTVGTVTFRAVYEMGASAGPPSTTPPTMKSGSKSSHSKLRSKSSNSKSGSQAVIPVSEVKPSTTPPVPSKPVVVVVDDEPVDPVHFADLDFVATTPVPPMEPVAKVAAPAPAAPAPAAKPAVVPPAAKAAPVAAPAKPAAAPIIGGPPAAAKPSGAGEEKSEEAADEEDDFQSFLKGLEK